MKHSLQSLWARLATPTPQGQRGIALLLTLGVLSLLLVLAMSFAYSTRTERQAAGNNADLIKARLLAESGLERVIATIRYAIVKGEHFGPKCSDPFSLIYPGTDARWTGYPCIFTPTTTDAADPIGSSLETILGSYTLPPGTETNSANWIHITGDDGKLIGRIAYVALPLFAQTSTDSFKVFSESSLPWQFDADAWYDSSLAVDHQRFNVSRTDWDSASAFQNPTAATKITTTGALPDYWNPSPPTVNTAIANRIPWLATLTDAGGTSVAKQVAANLIDYCDTNDVATSDFTAMGAPVTYVGLEEVPYINEVVITAGLTTVTGPPASSTLTLTANCELVNIYGTAHTGNVQVVVDYTLTGWPNAGPSLQQPAIAVPVGAHGYAQTGVITVSDTVPSSVASVTLTINKISVFEGSTLGVPSSATLYDYTMLLGTTAPVLNPLNAGSTQCLSVQVKDPRCNSSYTGNWEWGAWGLTAGTINSRNSNADASGQDVASPAGDLELNTTADPASGLSTACIRNGPMQSLWELGAIHRGEPWRTLNLSKYNTSVTTGTLSYTYTDGDANILDQVKLNDTASFPIRGRLNVNSPQPEWWASFLTNIKRGATTYTDTAGGTLLTYSDISGIFDTGTTGGIFTVNGAYKWATAGNKPFTNRGEIAKCTKLSTGTTDRAREEIIGKLADKLTARPNYFTVIVLAQSVKDTGIVNAGGNSVKYSGSNYCQVLAEQKILAVVSRDAFTTKFVIESFEYLEE